MVRVVKVEFRKGGSSSEFKNVVEFIKECLERVKGESKTFDKDLLKLLREKDEGYNEKTEYPIFKRYGFQVDLYHPGKKIAVEIEKSETKLVWKILCKFSMGSKRGKIKHAILIVPVKYWGKNKKSPTHLFSDAVKASKFMGQILWTKNLAIIGYEK
jgi:hypothetical protein